MRGEWLLCVAVMCGLRVFELCASLLRCLTVVIALVVMWWFVMCTVVHNNSVCASCVLSGVSFLGSVVRDCAVLGCASLGCVVFRVRCCRN